jgi:hypothetical protein
MVAVVTAVHPVMPMDLAAATPLAATVAVMAAVGEGVEEID